MARILIADDEMSFRKFVCEVVRRLDHTPVEAADGLEALSIYQSQDIDLSFIDVHMPKLGGLEFLRKVKEDDPHAVVVIMTGYPSAEGILETVEDDGYTYIAKPIQIEQIEDLIARGLENRKYRLEQAGKR